MTKEDRFGVIARSIVLCAVASLLLVAMMPFGVAPGVSTFGVFLAQVGMVIFGICAILTGLTALVMWVVVPELDEDASPFDRMRFRLWNWL